MNFEHCIVLNSMNITCKRSKRRADFKWSEVSDFLQFRHKMKLLTRLGLSFENMDKNPVIKTCMY